MSDHAALLQQVQDWRDAGHRTAIATVTQTWGSSPRPAGSMLVVNDKGDMQGSVSGGCIEGAVIREALSIMADHGPPRDLEFGVSNEEAWDVGLACGGNVIVHIEAVV